MSRLLTSLAASVVLGFASAAHAAESGARATQGESMVEVWIVLSEPALATLPADATEKRAALRHRIVAEQDRVMAQLRSLGAVESGRTQQTENALAVQLPAWSLESVKKIDGVIRVRPISHRNSISD